MGEIKYADKGNMTTDEIDKTIAIFIERTASCFGVVVSFAKCLHGIESSQSGSTDNRFTSTGNDYICLAQTNGVESINDGIG